MRSGVPWPRILRGWLHELLVEAASTIFCLALVLATAACASLRVADTQPLSPAKLEPLGADRISKGGYRVDVLPVSPDAPDLSGGGKRSASFGYGALEGMRDQALRTKRYLDADQTEYLHLSDGGVSDNLAMRSAGGMMQALSASGIRERGYQHIRRLLVISVDGQGTQDSSVARRKEVGGLFAILGLVSGAQIDSYNFETLTLVSQQNSGRHPATSSGQMRRGAGDRQRTVRRREVRTDPCLARRSSRDAGEGQAACDPDWPDAAARERRSARAGWA